MFDADAEFTQDALKHYADEGVRVFLAVMASTDL
jgi:hypothetical protein